MDKLAAAVAQKIKLVSPQETASIEVMAYSLTIILNTLLVCVCTLTAGLLLGNFNETAISLFAFMFCRFFSGGRHFKTSWQCNIFSTALCVLIPVIANFLSFMVMIGITLINIIIMLIFAPQPDKRAQLPPKLHPYFKLISVVGAAANLLLGSSVIALCYFAQALTIIPRGRRWAK